MAYVAGIRLSDNRKRDSRPRIDLAVDVNQAGTRMTVAQPDMPDRSILGSVIRQTSQMHNHATAASTSLTTKVAIIEDHHKFREALEFLLNHTPGYQCVGSFRSMEEALEKIKFNLPEVALVDIGLPGMSGVDGVRVLKEGHPSVVQIGR